jgi:hypothetical protein
MLASTFVSVAIAEISECEITVILKGVSESAFSSAGE